MTSKSDRTRQFSWALLGTSDSVDQMVDWLRLQAAHRVSGVCLPVPESAERLRMYEDVPRVGAWSDLVGQGAWDAVMVAAVEFPERRLALRQLADSRVPLLIELPLVDGILGAELAMIEAEQNATLVPLYLPAMHPLLWKLRQWVDDPSCSMIGQIEQVAIERSEQIRPSASAWQAFQQDSILLRIVLGPLSQIGAMGLGEPSSSLSASVQMRNCLGILGRWSLTGSRQPTSRRLIVSGTEGQAELEMPAELPGWKLSVSSRTAAGDLGLEQSAEPFSAPRATWELVQAALARARGEVEQREAAAASSPVPPRFTWEDAYRAAELAELAQWSARRGKVVDVHNERVTELDTFKSMMSATGCLMLLFSLVLLILVVIVDSLGLPIRAQRWWRLWPLYVVTPMLLFLAVQFLQWLFPRREGE